MKYLREHFYLLNFIDVSGKVLKICLFSGRERQWEETMKEDSKTKEKSRKLH